MTVAGDGVALSRRYFEDLVAPLLMQQAPEVRYAAARVGQGSEVLGFDDAMSRDHDWGLRLQLFVPEADQAQVLAALDQHLPTDFRGHPVRFGFSTDPIERLRIDVASVSAFAEQQLGFDPRSGPSPVDWLSMTGQAVLEIVSGAVFGDQTGELTGLREALRWYPDDIWTYVVACDWQRLDQELPLMGRAGDRGDEIGSRVIAARLVDVAVHLGFMLCRAWPPYSKWRGASFRHLTGCAAIAADLERALDARDWRDRQAALGHALTKLARLQRKNNLPVPQSAIEPFWDRPYVHLNRRLVPGLLETLNSSEVRALPIGVGSVEQQTDNVDVLIRPGHRSALAASLLHPQTPDPTS
ncbi:MAG TPA: DUF4037 domain-containing protein [Marmoricola sp.]|nr:DUF4037 domain-containing protein [Marmoricola sp.]